MQSQEVMDQESRIRLRHSPARTLPRLLQPSEEQALHWGLQAPQPDITTPWSLNTSRTGTPSSGPRDLADAVGRLSRAPPYLLRFHY